MKSSIFNLILLQNQNQNQYLEALQILKEALKPNQLNFDAANM